LSNDFYANKKYQFKIKYIPEIKLPRGYSIKFVKRSLRGKDLRTWKKIFNKKLRDMGVPKKYRETGEWKCIIPVFCLAEYNDEVIGVTAILIFEKWAELHYGYVFPEHRGKGIYKALQSGCLEYCVNRNIYHIRFTLSPEFLLRYWKKVWGEKQ